MSELDVKILALKKHTIQLRKSDHYLNLWLEESDITERELIDGAFYLAQRNYYRKIITAIESEIQELEGSDWGETNGTY